MNGLTERTIYTYILYKYLQKESLLFLYRELEDDLEKPEHQIWVVWGYESEVNYPWMFSDELKDIFDLWMTYHLDSDIVLPYRLTKRMKRRLSFCRYL